MNGFLVDTNVISEILRPAPDPHVAASSQRAARPMLFLVVSMGEPRKGITISSAGGRRTQLEKSIEARVPLEGRILPVTQAIPRAGGEPDGTRQIAGRPLSAPDGMIAASALEHGLTIAREGIRGSWRGAYKPMAGTFATALSINQAPEGKSLI